MSTYDHTDADETPHHLDYDLEEAVVISTTEQLKAVADETRSAILNLLSERAATVSQLAEALDKPKGTVGYHAKVLDDAGLIRVVRTNKVRAMTEKYYGRTGRTMLFERTPKPDDPMWFVTSALERMVVEPDSQFPMFTTRVARIPEEYVAEFADRILALADEFLALPRRGDQMFGFLAGVYPTDHPTLKEDT
ncbi:MAG: winged helix-turn-helix transcriptional regulator [Acidimicrobiia bacterium]|nr:winged helix-turn-helix transcriptional regulator [Acidimicrobiia bacterium]